MQEDSTRATFSIMRTAILVPDIAGLAYRCVGCKASRGVHAPHSSSASAADSIRSAWALASWFEYIGIWHGQRVANRAARSAMVALTATVALGRLGMPGRASHGNGVRCVASLIVSVFWPRSPNGDPTYYPHARAALAGTMLRDRRSVSVGPRMSASRLRRAGRFGR